MALKELALLASIEENGHSHSANDVDERDIMQNECSLKHFHIHDAYEKLNHLTLGAVNICLRHRQNVSFGNLHYCLNT
jgi:hypothetical protein